MSDTPELIYSIPDSKLNELRQLADLHQVSVSVHMFTGIESDYIQLLKSVITTQHLALESIVTELDSIRNKNP